MDRYQRALGGIALLAGLLLLPGTARAQQELYTFSAAALGGIGGSLDAEPGDDLGNTGYQLNASIVTAERTHVGFRVGQMGVFALTRADLVAHAGAIAAAQRPRGG